MQSSELNGEERIPALQGSTASITGLVLSPEEREAARKWSKSVQVFNQPSRLGALDILSEESGVF